MNPDPETAFWRDWLVELLQSGEAGRYLTPAELGRTTALLDDDPLDGRAIRSSVETIKGQYWRKRREENPNLFPKPDEHRWRCLNLYCLHKGRWWMSNQGVINCMNCRPLAFRRFVVAEGDASDAPLVEPDRSNQVERSDFHRIMHYAKPSPEPVSGPSNQPS